MALLLPALLTHAEVGLLSLPLLVRRELWALGLEVIDGLGEVGLSNTLVVSIHASFAWILARLGRERGTTLATTTTTRVRAIGRGSRSDRVSTGGCLDRGTVDPLISNGEDTKEVDKAMKRRDAVPVGVGQVVVEDRQLADCTKTPDSNHDSKGEAEAAWKDAGQVKCSALDGGKVRQRGGATDRWGKNSLQGGDHSKQASTSIQQEQGMPGKRRRK